MPHERLARIEPEGTRAMRGLSAFVKAPSLSDAGPHGQVVVMVNDAELGTLLSYCLSAAGFRARVSIRDTNRAEDVRRDVPEVVLFDARLDGTRSIDLWRQIRAASGHERPPAVIMFIADETDIDPRLSLEFGPCDFVIYPFSVRDLVLRIDAIIRLRREMARAAESHQVRRGGRYLVGRLELDVDRQMARVDGAPVVLSLTEMRVLIYLVENRDRVCSRVDLLTDVWGYRPRVRSRAPDIHVTRLRAKLGVAGDLIETIRGAGYRISPLHPVVVSG
jgi:two-component system, OmpR family, phosphate regulon response regulator PhoB